MRYFLVNISEENNFFIVEKDTLINLHYYVLHNFKIIVVFDSTKNKIIRKFIDRVK